VIEQRPSHNLVDENAPVLRIVAELHHVLKTVITLQEMRLRSSPHFPEQSPGDRFKWPRATFKLEIREVDIKAAQKPPPISFSSPRAISSRLSRSSDITAVNLRAAKRRRSEKAITTCPFTLSVFQKVHGGAIGKVVCQTDV